MATAKKRPRKPATPAPRPWPWPRRGKRRKLTPEERAAAMKKTRTEPKPKQQEARHPDDIAVRDFHRDMIVDSLQSIEGHCQQLVCTHPAACGCRACAEARHLRWLAQIMRNRIEAGQYMSGDSEMRD